MKLTALFSGKFLYAVQCPLSPYEYNRSKTSHSKICIFFSINILKLFSYEHLICISLYKCNGYLLILLGDCREIKVCLSLVQKIYLLTSF